MAYVPLQNISSYSLLQSPNTLPQMIDTVKKRGYQSLALTDENVMYGAVAFYKEANAHGIKPIIGLTLTVKGEFLTEHDFKLVLLAKNNHGYQNLMEISTKAMKADNVLALDDYKEYLADLFVLLPTSSEITNLINYDKLDQAKQGLDKINELSDKDSVRLGVTNKPDKLDDVKMLANDTNTKMIALNEVDYLKASELFNTKVLKSIENGNVMDDPEAERQELGSQWLENREDIEHQYTNLGLTDILNENEYIVENCNVQIEKQQPQLPKFETPNGQSSAEYLASLCLKGLQTRLKDTDANYQIYLARLKRELEVISRMGFDDYFLIVWDVINFAHNHDILTGPGRGSAAGSIVAYTLYITDVDPIKYDLLFERFLNEERAQMPDIDIDIPDDKRDQILNYVHDKYGDEHVAQIITFGTLGAKQSIRDVGRVFGMSPLEMNAWSKAIPTHIHETLKRALDESQSLKNIIADQPINKLLFDTATDLEGLPRHYSTHAAGLILSDQPIVKKSPLQPGNEGLLMTQYSKYYVEDVGLLKIDFLGLRNLSIMANILNMVHQQIDPKFDITKINLNDPKTLKLFQNGQTNGVFQFESTGIKNVLRKMHPTNFDLIAAVNALYRPGPMENIDKFIQRKNHPNEVNYPNGAIAKILGSTFGIIVYQEQVMQLASTMAGFTLGQADVLRRAMSKKHKNEMEAMKESFIAGALKNRYSKQVAETTFDYIERFASYGFNKSHAFAYSKMAFELAYLKAHYPGPFYTALLNSVLGNKVKIKTYVQEAKDEKIKVEGPNINQSESEFTYSDKTIRFGFTVIKGVRSDFIKAILAERDQNGPFKGLNDFINRIDEKFRKEDQLAALVYAGCFDQFEYNRREMIEAIPKLISSSDIPDSLFSDIPGMQVKIQKKEDFPQWEKINFENEYLGTYLSGHPVERYRDLHQQLHSLHTSELADGQKDISSILLVNHIKTIRTKKGDQMAFITASDEFGDVDITIFPNVYRLISSWLKPNIVITVNGSVQERRGLQIVADRIQIAANVVHDEKKQRKLYLRIDEQHDSAQVSKQLKTILIQHHGNEKVVLYQVKLAKESILPKQYDVTINSRLIDQLKLLFGNDNIVVQ
ncbi:DNA polymerase III subunit alpha [Fructilactobacillus sp. Tb1]|uniref:DNA polymerase III subunit alpha n=1 Tax=Fructilactobacillus sp. Tb1 TaxID=3422304 RepID=UPI003D2E27E1